MKSNPSKKDVKRPNILICGSMSHFKAMMLCSDQLKKRGIPTQVPENEQAVAELPKQTYLEEKSILSRKWLRNINSPSTYGILVVNESKKGENNYIGANTFAEIVVAFNSSKQIFLLHNLYPPYEDELLAWKVVPLLGQLDKLVAKYEEAQAALERQIEDLPKLQLPLPL